MKILTWDEWIKEEETQNYELQLHTWMKSINTDVESTVLKRFTLGTYYLLLRSHFYFIAPTHTKKKMYGFFFVLSLQIEYYFSTHIAVGNDNSNTNCTYKMEKYPNAYPMSISPRWKFVQFFFFSFFFFFNTSSVKLFLLFVSKCENLI